MPKSPCRGRQADAGHPAGGVRGEEAGKAHLDRRGLCRLAGGSGPRPLGTGSRDRIFVTGARERYNELYLGGRRGEGVPRSSVEGKLMKSRSRTVCGRQWPWFRQNIIHLLYQQSLGSYKPGTG